MLGFLQRELEPKREGESHLIFGEVDQRQLGKHLQGYKGNDVSVETFGHIT